MKTRSFFSLVLVPALLAAGCGGNNGPSAPLGDGGGSETRATPGPTPVVTPHPRPTPIPESGCGNMPQKFCTM